MCERRIKRNINARQEIKKGAVCGDKRREDLGIEKKSERRQKKTSGDYAAKEEKVVKGKNG